jgi:hypothetical protein
MNADPSKEMPSTLLGEDAPLGDGSTQAGDEPSLAVELDTSRPSEAVLRAAPIAVERGLDLTAASTTLGEGPPLELTIEASKAQARPQRARDEAAAPSHAGLPRWLTVTLALSLVALAAAVGSVWVR